jgi:hypothetical protein
MQTTEWVIVLCNSLVAGLLLFASFAKLVSPAALSRSLLLLTGRESLSTVTAVRAVGLVEIIVAIGLMFPDLRLTAAAALGVLGLVFAFSGAMARVRHIAEPCGCFGMVTSRPLGLLNVFFGAALMAVAAVNFLPRESLAAQYTVKLPVFTGILLCVICLALKPRAPKAAA